MHRALRPARALAAVLAATVAGGLVLAGHPAGATPASGKSWVRLSVANAREDAAALETAAEDLTDQAVAVGALTDAPTAGSATQRIYADVVALTDAARASDPSLAPQDTTAVMGAVPAGLATPMDHHAWHRQGGVTHTLLRWDGSTTATHPSPGWGMGRIHGGNRPAMFRHPDGVTVEPRVTAVADPTVGEVALRAALQKLGLPYVWAASGPTTFDCSGLTMWAYAHAGIALAHYTGTQWNEGRLIPARDILPGDLILFGNPAEHVGMYLGAGWMLNAPYTSQYVDVVPVPTGVAGVVRP
jgi:cell wall-associated NlpC family hydrolase